MSPEIVAAVVGGLAGLATGIIGSLAAPWVHWAIERRRKDIEYKMNAISCIRNLLDSVETIAEVKASSYWGFISEHLNEDESKIVFSQATIVIRNDTADQNVIRKRAISKMLVRLEKEWKLLCT